MRRFGWLLWGALALPVGCSGDPAPPPTAADQVVARMQGEWRISLSPEQRRQARMMKFLLQEPTPSNDDLAVLKLTDDEAASAVVILNELRYDPDGERTQQLRAAIAGLEAGELSFGPDRLVVRLGGVEKAGTYTVVSSTGERTSRHMGQRWSDELISHPTQHAWPLEQRTTSTHSSWHTPHTAISRMCARSAACSRHALAR